MTGLHNFELVSNDLFTSFCGKTVQSTKVGQTNLICLTLKSIIILGDNSGLLSVRGPRSWYKASMVLWLGETRALLANFKKSYYSYDVVYFPDVGNWCNMGIVVVVSGFIHSIASLKMLFQWAVYITLNFVKRNYANAQNNYIYILRKLSYNYPIIITQKLT